MLRRKPRASGFGREHVGRRRHRCTVTASPFYMFLFPRPGGGGGRRRRRRRNICNPFLVDILRYRPAACMSRPSPAWAGGGRGGGETFTFPFLQTCFRPPRACRNQLLTIVAFRYGVCECIQAVAAKEAAVRQAATDLAKETAAANKRAAKKAAAAQKVRQHRHYFGIMSRIFLSRVPPLVRRVTPSTCAPADGMLPGACNLMA